MAAYGSSPYLGRAEGQRTPELNATNFPAPTRRIARVDFTEELRPEEHLPKTFRLRLIGWKAAQVKPEVLAAILLDEGLIDSADVWKNGTYYRLHNPTERYISFVGQETKHRLKSGEKFDACFDPSDRSRKGTIEIEEVGCERTKIMLQFAPAAATREFMLLLLKKAGIDAEELERHHERADLWRCVTNQKEIEVPHYITGTFSSSKAPDDKKAILVTVPGRMIECYYCGQTTHWSNRCDDGKEVRQSRYQIREEEKIRRRERNAAAQQELAEAQERQKAKEREEDQIEIRRQEEEEREAERREEEEEEREMARMQKEERVKEEREKAERERKVAEAEAKKEKAAREKNERKKKDEEETKLIEDAIILAQKERETAGGDEDPSPRGEAASNLRGDEADKDDDQDKHNESLSFDQGPFGFKNSPFPVPVASRKNSSKMKTPVRALFDNGGGQLEEEMFDDDLTSSGNIASFQRPKPKKRKVDGQDDQNSEGGTDDRRTDEGPPEFKSPAIMTPRLERSLPLTNSTPFTWEELSDEDSSENNKLEIATEVVDNQPEQPLD